MTEQRFAKAEFAAWLGIIGNLALAIMKGVVGFFSGSKALIADAANSASDVAGSFAVLIGLRAAKRPPDKDHPYGHGKAESIAAIIVSVLLLLVGFEVARGAIVTIFFTEGPIPVPEAYAIWALVAAIVVKEILFRYKFRLGKELNSQALIATAWDHRSDVMASGAALVGVAGSVLGGRYGIGWLAYADPVAGLLVAGLVLLMGYRLIMEAIHNTLDHVLHTEDAEELVQAAQHVKGVITVDELRAREHGHYVIVDAKISVNPRITVLEGHDIAKAVKHELMNKFSHVSDVFVHVNPYDPGFPYKNVGDAAQDETPSLLH
ncbi:cation diffusion facilitator family transporter [Paenibacillus sp.]|uniref:cation diffusion facilitator family transporter n=1 Tax=Paenibacillus sp. TaxID=58172 RepID=UPI002D74F98F|nr:cation diffusion facilitator family transporter [Paenibacillus sp.]HZG57264.1 cation diffusion facilitator family transporter [Paenibacillus sp.]